MKKNKDLLINSIYLITLIILYYIIGKKSIYLYVLTISLSNIFLSCISNITIKPTLDNTKAYHTKEKVFKLTTLTLIFIMLIIALLSICISDITSIFLHISDTLPIFVLMAISTINKPLINIYTEYLENVTNKKLQERSIFIYQVLSNILLILTAILAFRIFKTSIILAISLLYGSRI